MSKKMALQEENAFLKSEIKHLKIELANANSKLDQYNRDWELENSYFEDFEIDAFWDELNGGRDDSSQ